MQGREVKRQFEEPGPKTMMIKTRVILGETVIRGRDQDVFWGWSWKNIDRMQQSWGWWQKLRTTLSLDLS